jgi:predicted dehydrogenase
VVAENYQFKPLYHRIRQCVEDGLIGQPLIVELSKTARQRATGWRTDPELMGGGALLEGGVHWVNALVTLAGGMPVAVCALKPGVAYGMVSPLEDTLLLTVKFDNGVLGKLTHSWHIPNPFLGLGSSRVYGTEGVIAFESNGLVACVFGKRRKLIWASPFRFMGYQDMLRTFVEDYCSGRPWQTPSMDRIASELRLVHAAYRSIDSGRFEEI